MRHRESSRHHGVPQGAAVRWMAQGGRKCRVVGMALILALGCDSSDPAPDPFPGRWLLETVNGVSLPATGDEIGNGDQPVLSGRLGLTGGLSVWEYCVEDNGPSLRGVDEIRYVDGDPATVAIIFPGFVAIDTLRLSGEDLVWEYNLGNSPGNGIDQLRFRRLADGEAEGPVCNL